jgi:hypothetical protein
MSSRLTEPGIKLDLQLSRKKALLVASETDSAWQCRTQEIVTCRTQDLIVQADDDAHERSLHRLRHGFLIFCSEHGEALT